MLNYDYLLILTGLPASGKSTFAHLFKKVLEYRKNIKVKIIDPDEIRKRLLPEDFDYRKEKSIRERSLTEARSAMRAYSVVVSDDLNYYASMRHDLKKIAENLKKDFIIIHISTPLEICLEWNEKRGSPIPNKVITAIYNKSDAFNTYNWDNPFNSIDLSKIGDLQSEIDTLITQIDKELNLKHSSLKNVEDHNKRDTKYNKELDKITRNVVKNLFKNQIYQPHINKILKLRKEFIKKNLNKSLKIDEISNQFINFLHEYLN